MKAVKFLLKSVLQLYAMQEENARADLGRAIHARESVGEMLAAARHELEAQTQAYCAQRTRMFSARSLAECWDILQERQAACTALEQRLALAAEAEARVRGTLVGAWRRHHAMLELHGRHVEKQRLAQLRHDELALADAFQANHLRRQRRE